MESNRIGEDVKVAFRKTIDWYKWLHANPELSGNEMKTADFISDVLNSLGISSVKRFAKNGLVAEIDGGKPGRHIAFRAELDALPITEATMVDFKSTNQGVMHACGHDFHMAALLGVASVIVKNRDSLHGKISLIFQPSEEKLPGGAQQMLKEGLFETHHPDLIIAQHVFPDLPAGVLGFREGAYMASGDEIDVVVQGKGGHAALPHLSNDVLLTMAHTLIALQQIRSRFVNQSEPFVLSFGKMEAMGANNILPQEAKMEGTMRTLCEKWRAEAKMQIRTIVENCATMYGCVGTVQIREGYPVLVNDPFNTFKIKKLAREVFGVQRVFELPIRMTTDDFSYFAQKFPSVYYRVGVGRTETEANHGLHTSQFIPDIAAIETAIRFSVEIIFNLQ